MQDNRARDGGEDRFQAQQQGRYSRIGMFLSKNLQRISDAAGKNSGI